MRERQRCRDYGNIFILSFFFFSIQEKSKTRAKNVICCRKIECPGGRNTRKGKLVKQKTIKMIMTQLHLLHNAYNHIY